MSVLENALEIKKNVAAKYELPGIVMEWLRGESEQEIEEDAKRFAKLMGIDIKPMDVSKATPGEVRANAKEILHFDAEKLKAETVKAYQEVRTPEEIREDWKKRLPNG